MDVKRRKPGRYGSWRQTLTVLILLLLVQVGCSRKDVDIRERGVVKQQDSLYAKQASSQALGQPTVDATKEKTEPPPPTRRSDLKEPVWKCENGSCSWIEKDSCSGGGLRVIDLSEEFLPYIFWECTPGKDDCKPNPYSDTYRNLAGDLTDEEGHRLKPGEHNYLELYGIPPTLAVLDRRFIHSSQGCALHQDYDIFRKDAGTLYYVSGREGSYRRALLYWAKKAGMRPDTEPAEVERRMKTVKKRRNHLKYRKLKRFWKALVRYRQLVALQDRLVCEEILRPGTFRKGYFDWNTRRAVRIFERKHMVYGWGRVDSQLRQVLARTMLENDFEALRRVMRERVAHSVAILEDGSVKKWRDSRGRWHKVPDLVHSFRDLVMKAMGLTAPKSALEFFRAHDIGFFRGFHACVKLPPLPSYYSDDMDFSAEIHRGDVWYDVPVDSEGHRRPQPVHRKPRLWIFVGYGGERIPIARLGTTIGGWMKEYAEGEVFLKYKESDVGARQWKYVVSAPVWFPPKTTPPRELLRRVRRRGRWIWTVKKRELGPSYASAYGLVMALHTYERKLPGGRIRDVDLGIRTHGSVNYMSILRSHSHGCHRLHNHLAVRLFSVILRRHAFERMGPQYKKWTHVMEYEDKTYRIELDYKGYYYRLSPPVPVMVTRGRIMGKVTKPIRDLIRIPGHEYKPEVTIGMVIGEDGQLIPYSQTVDATTPDDSVPTAVPDGAAADATAPAKSGPSGEIVPDGTDAGRRTVPVIPGGERSPVKPAVQKNRPMVSPARKDGRTGTRNSPGQPAAKDGTAPPAAR